MRGAVAQAEGQEVAMAKQDEVIVKPIADVIPELMEHAIKPNAEAIARIVLAGAVALVAYKPDPKWCKTLGLEPNTSVAVAVLPGPMRKAMIKNGDSVTSRWLRGGRTGRIFVVWNVGTLLVNFDGREFSLEPGSTDGETS